MIDDLGRHVQALLAQMVQVLYVLLPAHPGWRLDAGVFLDQLFVVLDCILKLIERVEHKLWKTLSVPLLRRRREFHPWQNGPEV